MGSICGKPDDASEPGASKDDVSKPDVPKAALTMVGNMEEFKAFKAKNSVCIIAGLATWCPPCVNIAPKYEAMSSEFEGKCAFGKFDVDKAEDVKADCNITCMPTFIIFKNAVEVDRLEGASEEHIR